MVKYQGAMRLTAVTTAGLFYGGHAVSVELQPQSPLTSLRPADLVPDVRS